MDDRSQATGLLGRADLLGRLETLISTSAQRGSLLVVEGLAGIGKTSLVREASTFSQHDGIRVGWGTCVDGAATPGYWPWTQALNAVARAAGMSAAIGAAGDDRQLVSVVVTSLAPKPAPPTVDGVPLLGWDAVVRWLSALGEDGQMLIVLDDLHWADDSSLALLEFIATSCELPGVCVIGMLRPDELTTWARTRINVVVGHATHLRVDGLERDAILDELRRTTTPTGHPREFANRPAERARKAVSSRIRAAIATIATALPELGEHLSQAIITGTYCRYAPSTPDCWDVGTRDVDASASPVAAYTVAP